MHDSRTTWPKMIRWFRINVAIIFLAIITIFAFIPVFTYLFFAKDLKSKESIMNRNNTGVVLLDRNDKPFFTFYEANYKEFVPLNLIPLAVQQSVIAVEDKEFYQHPGFSLRGILRSLILDIKAKDTAYGGSTLTQQLVKNALLNSNKNLLRKYQEIVLAQEIERRYNKKEILEMYLNSVYFGQGAFGIEQAAQRYFNKHASELTLSESSLLAGILAAPSKYSPFINNGILAKQRQILVLNSMEQLGYINSKQKETAEKEHLVFASPADGINSTAAHFALMVLDKLKEKYGEEQISRSGFRVKTTLDIDWQKYAENVLSKQVDNLESSNVTNGAAVAVDPKNGEVRVLVGSKDWYNESYGKMNLAITPRSPGSAFKPIIYAAAFEERVISPATPLRDEPTTFPENYKPQDYDRKFRGIVLARRALANSLNIPAVYVMQKVGVPSGLEMGKRLGLTTLKDPSDYGLSLVLGTAEVSLVDLTNAYATFANKGIKHDLTTILKITDKQNKTVYQYKAKGDEVLEPGVAFLISSILSDSHARNEVFGTVLDTNIHAAVKTGTGEDYKNALTIGYTPEIAVGVWLGNNNNKPMSQIAGSIGPAPIWRSLIEHYSAGQPVANFTPPDSITQRSICSFNGLVATKGMAGMTEYFLAGTEPRGICYIPKPTINPIGDNDIFRNIRSFKKSQNDNKKLIPQQSAVGAPIEKQVLEAQKKIQEQVQKQLDQMKAENNVP